MKSIQALSDAINLLATITVPRASRPGEVFDQPERGWRGRDTTQEMAAVPSSASPAQPPAVNAHLPLKPTI